jgi:hypothetical protein
MQNFCDRDVAEIETVGWKLYCLFTATAAVDWGGYMQQRLVVVVVAAAARLFFNRFTAFTSQYHMAEPTLLAGWLPPSAVAIARLGSIVFMAKRNHAFSENSHCCSYREKQ